MKSLIFVLFITILFAHASAQEAVIHGANMQIYASLNNKPQAWATDAVEIHVNKVSGEFTAAILIDNLNLAIINPDFTGYTGENRGKYLTLRGILPINDVINNYYTVLDLNVELTANFNNIDYPTTFTFSILRMSANNNKGFSVMSKGSISISKLEINNLRDFDDELGIALNFTGY
jgi:hypothetical protein